MSYDKKIPISFFLLEDKVTYFESPAFWATLEILNGPVIHGVTMKFRMRFKKSASLNVPNVIKLTI